MKKYRTLITIVLATLLVVGCLGQKKPQSYKVGILQLTNLLVDVEKGFKAGMVDVGYTEGENVEYVYRDANGNMDDLGRMAQELMDEKVDLVVSITTPSSIMALQASQGTDIPIVFILVSDPVRAGLVESNISPGGRVTGIRDGGTDTAGKRLELLKRMAPDIKTVLTVYSDDQTLLPAQENVRKAADKLGLTLVEKQVTMPEEAIAAFESIQPGEVDAIFMPSDAMVSSAREAALALSARDGIPHIFPGKQPGILAGYGENFGQAGAQAASLVDKILNGADPGSLPVEISKKFDLIIDLGVAKEIDLDIPADVLAMADVVVQ